MQQCWVWNDSVSSFVKDRIKGYSLNVCAGKNLICNVNLDADETARKRGQLSLRNQDGSFIKGNMNLLPFKPNSFDTVVSDPPWKIGYYERFRPFFECVRVCKVSGIIIYNAYWIPMTPSGDVELTETWVRQDRNFTNTSIISIFKKVKDNPTYNELIAKESRLGAEGD